MAAQRRAVIDEGACECVCIIESRGTVHLRGNGNHDSDFGPEYVGRRALSSFAAPATIAVLNILRNYLSIAFCPVTRSNSPCPGIPHMSYRLWLVNVQVLRPSADCLGDHAYKESGGHKVQAFVRGYHSVRYGQSPAQS
jgi:hypothetical protein